MHEHHRHSCKRSESQGKKKVGMKKPELPFQAWHSACTSLQAKATTHAHGAGANSKSHVDLAAIM